MDAVPQLVNVAPVAGAGAADAAGPTSDQAIAAAFQLPVGAADPAADASTATVGNLRRAQRGETLPEGGNLLPLVVGLLPPVTSLAAPAAPAQAADTGAAPAHVAPPAVSALSLAVRPSVERSARSASPPRPAASAFEHLLASNLPAAARAALAAALEASASAIGDSDVAATPAPRSSSPPAAVAVPATVSDSTLALLVPPSPDGAGDDLPGPIPSLPPSSRAATPTPVVAPTPAALPAERRDAAPPPSAAEAITLECAAPAVVIETGARPEHGADLTAAADSPPPAVAHLMPGPPRAAEGGAVMNLATPVGSPGWSDAVGERVAWLVQQDLGQAHLKLNPPQLGPVEVRVQINGDQAAVSFTAHNQQTRDALADASQRLRDLLGAQGFVNVQVDVGQQPFQERPTLVAPYEDDAAPAAAGRAAGAATAPSTARGLRALLDAYA